METRWIRFIFFSLMLAFLAFTGLVATSITEYTRGQEYNNASAQSGKLIFQKYNCTACHQVYGLGGYMGPDLTNVMSCSGKGEPYVRALLKSGTGRMPDFNLLKKEVDDLVAYLNYLDHTGISPVQQYTISKSGTVNYQGQ